MFHIVLVQPEIPPNTGNVIRLAANTGCSLHLIEPLGFSHGRPAAASAPAWTTTSTPHVQRHASLAGLAGRLPARPGALLRLQHPRPGRLSATCAWQRGDWLVFGSESAGLPAELLAHIRAGAARCACRCAPGQRSLNLSNAVAVAVFEAWRQNGYAGSS